MSESAAPLAVPAESPSPHPAPRRRIRGLLKLALLAVVFLNETLWYVLVARVFSSRKAQAVYGRLKRRIDRVFGALMAALAVKMAAG